MNAKNFISGIPLDFQKVDPCKLNWVIYLLVHNGEIVYVGKSSYRGYTQRIKSHAKDKVFDEAYVAQVSDSEQKTLQIESSFISMLQPKYNVIDNRFRSWKVSKGLANIKTAGKTVYSQSKADKIAYFLFIIAFVVAYPISSEWSLFALLVYVLYHLNGITKATIKYLRKPQSA